MRPSIASTLIAVLLFGACGDESDASHHGGKAIDDWPSGAVLLLEDHQDTVVAEVDAHGRPVSQTADHPYGGVRGQIGAGDPWKFVGNELDAGSGLADFRARPYRPEAGLFLSVD